MSTRILRFDRHQPSRRESDQAPGGTPARLARIDREQTPAPPTVDDLTLAHRFLDQVAHARPCAVNIIMRILRDYAMKGGRP